MTGTPARNNPSELYPQIHVIDSSIFPTAKEFETRYCDAAEISYKPKAFYLGNKMKNLNELNLLMQKVAIRRYKDDFPEYFSTKSLSVKLVEPDLKNYKRLYINNMDEKSAKSKGFYSRTGKAKALAVCEHVNNLLEQGNKFIVVTQHFTMRNKLENMCEEKNHNYVKVYGNTLYKERKSIIDKFRNDPDCKLAIFSFRTICGLNLSGNFEYFLIMKC
jgi:SWI/SNF-related matrix-associated actin-dependent regulator 1 of chromatin subfamily A